MEIDTRNGEINIEHHEMSGLDVENSEIAKKIDGEARVLVGRHVEKNRAASRNRCRLDEIQRLSLIFSAGKDR